MAACFISALVSYSRKLIYHLLTLDILKGKIPHIKLGGHIREAGRSSSLGISRSEAAKEFQTGENGK
jgi:hypothetical protein